MPHTLILLSCVMILMTSLFYLADTADKFVSAATQVHCEQHPDFSKCSQEFKDKTYKLMRK